MSKSNIIKFPKRGHIGSMPPPKEHDGKQPVKPQSKPKKDGGVLAAIVRWIWVAVVLVWPVLKWIVSIEVFFQVVRTFYYWNNPEVHAGWTFLAHFSVLLILIYFVSVFKPKGI